MTKDTQDREKAYDLAKWIISVNGNVSHNEITELAALVVSAMTTAPSQDSDCIMMPKALTGENGAKCAFIGEFTEQYEVHDGTIYYVPVTWTTIKEIYKKAVDLFGQE